MQFSNLEANLKRLAEILKESPATTHIFFRREDDVRVDIPVAQAEFKIRTKPNWIVEDGAFPAIELAVIGNKEELPVLPPKPSEEKKPAPVEDLKPLPPLKPKAKSKKTK